VASVYKRGSNYWIRYQWRGKEVRRSARTSSKAVAQQFLSQCVEETRRIDRGGRPRRPLNEALDRFWIEHLPNLKPKTQARYRSSFRLLSPSFGDLYLDQITKGRLADYVAMRIRGGAKGATIRRDLAALSIVCSCAVDWDWMDVNPVKLYSKRHIKEAPPQTTYPTVEQVNLLVSNASPMAGRIIRILAETGMRQEEACSLEWSQVSLARREIRLIKTKTSAPRVIPLSDVALSTLVGTPRHLTKPWVFWHNQGERYGNFAGIFRKIARRAGVQYRCHDLRHHFASEFAQRVGDLAALQAILGHKTIQMTMRYSHLVTEHLHRAMAKHSAGTGSGTSATKLFAQTVPDRPKNEMLIETVKPQAAAE
jgi:integrase